MRIDLVRQEIANLGHRFPQLMEDADAWAISIESETSTFDVLRQIERRRLEALAMAGGLSDTIADLEARQARFFEREKAMRALAFRIMEIADLRKAEFAEATYSIRAGQQKLIGDADPESLSEEFQRLKVELDRNAITKALKAGQTITGFELSNAEPTLSIRTK